MAPIATNRTATSAICVQAKGVPACCVPAADDCSNMTVDLKATYLLLS
jgi:hypothetical protein